MIDIYLFTEFQPPSIQHFDNGFQMISPELNIFAQRHSYTELR